MMKNNLTNALKAWTEVLSRENVITDEQEMMAAQTATFATTQRVTAIITPGSREDVQACVRIACQYKIPLYPVSTGKNWGYGSRVPPRDGSVIIALNRLNRILDFDAKLATITVEPGVTFNQVYEFLRNQNSDLAINCPGSSADTSIVGNALERGVSHGLDGDKCSQICGLEVVLGSGECIHTGLERFPRAQAAKGFSWGVGPSMDGLFSQSNLGIVTKLTVWLTPIPKYSRYFSFSINTTGKLAGLIDTLQSLKRERILETTCGLYNHYRVITFLGQYPWKEFENQTIPPGEVLETFKDSLGGGIWFGEAAVTAANEEIGNAKSQLVQQRLSPRVDDIEFQKPNSKNPLIGTSSDTGLSSVYWRKRTPPPKQMDPDRDRCGVIWCSPVVPFEGKAVNRCVKIIEEAMLSFNFEPNLAIQCISMRAVYIISSIVYDRDQTGQDEVAKKCHDILLERLTESGFIPYRLGIQAMDALPEAADDYINVLRTLKSALDPADILAPGRYDFRNKWNGQS